MKKKYILFLLLFPAFSTFVRAQEQAHTSPPIDSRPFDVFENGYIKHLKSGNPFLIQRLNYCPGHSW